MTLKVVGWKLQIGVSGMSSKFLFSESAAFVQENIGKLQTENLQRYRGVFHFFDLVVQKEKDFVCL